MALTFNGTVVIIDSSQIPAGYVKPTVTTFGDPEAGSINASLTIAKSAVEDPSDVVTFGNILDNVTVGVNKQIEDKLNAELDVAGNTIDAYAELRAVKTNQIFGDDLYNDSTVVYRCAVRIFWKFA